MLGSSARRYGHIKCWGNNVWAIGSPNIGQVLVALKHPTRTYCKKDDCCKDLSQTAGRNVEPWPKNDITVPPWRCECPMEPQPPNYDPYRIKVPDITVPPLPPSNVKTGFVLLTSEKDDQGYHQGYQQGHYGECEEPQKEEKDEGLLGLLKSFFGKGKKDKGSEEQQMAGLRDLQWNLIRYK